MLAEAERRADDPDWRAREWVALLAQRAARPGRAGPAAPERVERWRQLRDRLAADPHPHVSSAADRPPLLRGMHFRSQPSPALEFYTSGVAMPDDEVLGWRSAERQQVAGSAQAHIPAGLLSDPECEIRASAVRHIAAAAVDDTTLARLRNDPCPQVRDAVMNRYGPDPGILVNRLPDRERILAARITEDAVLTTLAADPSVDVRLEVARNQHCPCHLLPSLARHPVVFGAAVANPAWPHGLPPPDPFAPAGP